MSGIFILSKTFSTQALKVVHNAAKRQFIVSLTGAEAVVEYEMQGKNLILHSTNVPQEFQGKGVGKLLAQYAFNHAVERKLDVTCKCHYLAKYYKRNMNKYTGLIVKLEIDK